MRARPLASFSPTRVEAAPPSAFSCLMMVIWPAAAPKSACSLSSRRVSASVSPDVMMQRGMTSEASPASRRARRSTAST